MTDCPCGGQVVLEIDESGVWETCVRCGSAQRPVVPVLTRTEARRLARLVVEMDRKGKPSC